MNINPSLLALMAALCFGLMLIPWNITLQKMGNPQFSITIGIIFAVLGLTQQIIFGGKVDFRPNALLWSLFSAGIYILAITSFNYAVATPGAKLGVLAAITATYPAITIASGALLVRQMPSPKEIFFVCLTVIGIIGLSLSGKGH